VTPVQYVPLNKASHNNLNNINAIMKADFSDILLDVRSEEEYKGDIRYPRSGHIPGAKSWEWLQAVDFDNGFTFKNNISIKNQLQQLGISKLNTPITVYCQSGHRASHSYFTLRNLGFTNVKLYDGSMAEYSQVKSALLTKGMSP
jgi:thiosulfate/3-mercaptopyruvate sulfurtransferase